MDNNVFAYCANNPVMFKDDSGEFVISISIGIGSLLTWAAYGIATAVGVGAGVAIGTAVGIILGVQPHMLIHVPIVRQKRKTEESKNLRLYIFIDITEQIQVI